jgi:hypothetical protein
MLGRRLQSNAFGAPAEPDARPAAVLIDEVDAGLVKSSLDDVESCTSRIARAGFQLSNRHDADPCSVSKLLLSPIKKAPGGPTLRGSEHGTDYARFS